MKFSICICTSCQLIAGPTWNPTITTKTLGKQRFRSNDPESEQQMPSELRETSDRRCHLLLPLALLFFFFPLEIGAGWGSGAITSG